MATIEGLYLADDRDNLIFEYPTTSSSPNLKTILATVKGVGYQHLQNDAIVEISSTDTVYKVAQGRIVLYALIQRLEGEESLNLKSLKGDAESDNENGYENMADSDEEDGSHKKPTTHKEPPSLNTLNPNLFFVFLERLLNVLQDYFGSPLSPIKVEANYDIMCNLMQELIEGGYPYITDMNTLKELVPFKQTLGSKLLSTTNQLTRGYASSSHSTLQSLSNTTEKSVPWRKSNVRYTNNELFVDIKEQINVVLSHQPTKKNSRYKISNKLVPTVAVIKGEIDFTSHLSGVPDIQLVLNLNGHYLGIPSFHRCIKTEKWIANQGLLSFIPPDGKTTIVNYTIDLDQYPLSKIQRNIGLVNADYKEGLGTKKNEFEITLNLNLYKNVSKIEDLKITIKTEPEQKIKILRLSHGDFQTKSNGKFQWIFDQQTSLGINPILRGIVEVEGEDYSNDIDVDGETSDAAFPKLTSLSYNSKGALPSGIRVDSLKILRGLTEVRPYKGVKYITTTGDFVIR